VPEAVRLPVLTMKSSIWLGAGIALSGILLGCGTGIVQKSAYSAKPSQLNEMEAAPRAGMNPAISNTTPIVLSRPTRPARPGVAATARMLTMLPTTLPPAVAGTPYSFALTAVGGTPPYTWDGGAWTPVDTNGLTINKSSGIISGTPTYTGTMPLIFEVVDSNGAASTVQYDLRVTGTGSSGTITGSPLSGIQGQSYTWNYGASLAGIYCGPASRFLAGVVPPGLGWGLNPVYSPTQPYSLYGTPDIAGEFTFTISYAEVATGSCTPTATNAATFSVTIAPATSPASPAGSSNWTRQSTAAVVAPTAGQWDGFAVRAPSVIKVGSTYVMYYEGEDSATHTRQIGRAVSSDGLSWTKSPATPVLAVGPSGAWDSGEVRYPSVFYDGTTYRMWYWGAGSGCDLMGLATSSDGITWTRPQTASGFGSCDFAGQYAPGAVIKNGSTFMMWYWEPLGEAIGLATSADGISWTNSGLVNMPVDFNNGAGFSRPVVVLDGTTFRMWFARHYGFVAAGNASGFDIYKANMGYATSSDGLNWSVYPASGATVFGAGRENAWDHTGVGDAAVIKDGTKYRMWYTGGRINMPSPGYYAFVEGAIGYAAIP
jgi:predicted GH43/DUF377 family glycosyl hydrolase